MTWLPWFALIPCMLWVAWSGLSAFGQRRWARAMRALQDKLEASRVDGMPNATGPHTRYDVHELEGLPVPVQR